MLTLPIRAAVVGVSTFALLAAATSAASAHVTVTPSTTTADSYAVLTFAFSHGCEGSPTTAMTIAMPEEIVDVTPTIHPQWEVEKVMEHLDDPIDDGHGGQLTERVSEVVYTATSGVPDGLRDTLDLSLQLRGTAGDTLVFPVVQECAEGENAWIQTVESGEPEPDYPAPAITLTSADGDADDAAATPNSIAWIALGLGALGTVMGAVALARARRFS